MNYTRKARRQKGKIEIKKRDKNIYGTNGGAIQAVTILYFYENLFWGGKKS